MIYHEEKNKLKLNQTDTDVKMSKNIKKVITICQLYLNKSFFKKELSKCSKNVCLVLNRLLNIIRIGEKDLKRELLSLYVSQCYSKMRPYATWICLPAPSVESILHLGKVLARLCTGLEAGVAGAPSDTARKSFGWNMQCKDWGEGTLQVIKGRAETFNYFGINEVRILVQILACVQTLVLVL